MNIIPQEIQIALSPAVIQFLEDGPASAPELQCFINGFAQCQAVWAKDREELQATIQTLSGHLKLVNVNCNDLKAHNEQLQDFIRDLMVYMVTLLPKKNLDKRVTNSYINEGNRLLKPKQNP